MYNDATRGLESPDRSDVSPIDSRVRTDGGKPADAVRERLRAIDALTRSLLADIQQPIEPLEHTDPETRREAARHVREIRAETGRVGLLLYGPEGSIPYRPSGSPNPDSDSDSDLDLNLELDSDSDTNRPRSSPCGPMVTTYAGPDPAAFEDGPDETRDADTDGSTDGLESRTETESDSESESRAETDLESSTETETDDPAADDPPTDEQLDSAPDRDETLDGCAPDRDDRDETPDDATDDRGGDRDD